MTLLLTLLLMLVATTQPPGTASHSGLEDPMHLKSRLIFDIHYLRVGLASPVLIDYFHYNP